MHPPLYMVYVNENATEIEEPHLINFVYVANGNFQVQARDTWEGTAGTQPRLARTWARAAA